MRIVQVPLGNRSYNIKVGGGLLSRLGVECAQLKLGQRCAVITDANVGRHFAKAALKSLSASGFEPFLITVPAGYAHQVLPLGLTFMGRPWAEATLLRLAYAFEQAHPVRRPPSYRPTLLDLP